MRNPVHLGAAPTPEQLASDERLQELYTMSAQDQALHTLSHPHDFTTVVALRAHRLNPHARSGGANWIEALTTARTEHEHDQVEMRPVFLEVCAFVVACAEADATSAQDTVQLI